ncbi:Serine--pyruvate aminotransferase (EC / L-alanine:glyoxylate aminotransferase (EC [uncultured Gammaproteobacteria bacterium]|nr:Serine--pyruvate aminotransferase (EC / L-alanine:glyoxylate aminotransferase (EC [uncultured Gammaproteobacteria bacterium]
MPVSAPGSAGMETCFANLVEPGDKVVVVLMVYLVCVCKKTSPVLVVWLLW